MKLVTAFLHGINSIPDKVIRRIIWTALGIFALALVGCVALAFYQLSKL